MRRRIWIWLLLTKRPQNWEKRMGELLGCYLAMNRTEGNAARLLESWFGARVAPANVWIGTTVEDQARADERIPQLLQIPAKVRFLSCEPLLGAVDLSECFSLWEYCGGCGEQFDFVEGRPDECPSCKRKWCMCVGYGEGARRMHFDADGRIEVCDGAPIHWVICGGESGPNARPMHPDWARSLRDQCAAAGVPFLFKQWGEWRPTFALHDFIDDDGEDFARGDFTGYERVGKKTAGRLLDGKEHNAFPV
nr:DUF5131 family protein [Chthoniobacter flavus]